MEKFGKSNSVTRKEDQRFLMGKGRYIDDVAPEGALVAHVFRSPVAHAEITGLNLDDARQADGVHLVLSAKDLEAEGIDLNMPATVLKNRDGSRGADPMRPLLAQGRVRFVGEAVAIVIADTLAQAKDAAELIEFDYDDLPVHVTPQPGGAAIHDEAPDNVALDWSMGDQAATKAAFAKAAHHISVDIADNRVIANSMEPRGAWANWDGKRLHVDFSGQGVWDLKDKLAGKLGLKTDQVRVTTPDVGGGFGMKGMTYPEYYLIALATRKLGRPVRWIAERGEGMLTDNAGRDLTSTAELAFDADHKITAYHVTTVCNLGAYNSEFGQPIQTELFSKVLMGCYDVQTSFLGVKCIYTNTTQVDAYRGAGRPEAIYVLERAMDHAARELGIDAWDLRRKNFIPVDKFPYVTTTGETYDVGDFHRVLSSVEDNCDRAGYEARKAASKAEGKLRGLGLCYYIESILGSAIESARVVFNEDGTVSLFVGTQSNGQGHETVFAQFLADQTGIPADMINVIQGDSDLIASGGGTGGSRSVTTQGTATLATSTKIIDSFAEFLEGELGGKVSFDDQTFRTDASNQTPTMQEVAEMARAAGRMDLLDQSAKTKLPGRSYPNGGHVAEVEIDPETGQVEVVRYTVTDDFGNLINPMLAEGQVHGGVAQGIGQAVTEHVVYDGEGQLLSATFMDYAMPRADDMPMIAFSSEPVPSTANPLGMKGCGEAGTVGALAAVSNAVLDALYDEGVRHVDMPFTPNRVWSWLNDRKIAAA